MPSDQRRNVDRDYILWYDNRRRYVEYWLYKAGPLNGGRRFKISNFETFNDALDFANSFHYKGSKDLLETLRRTPSGKWYKWGTRSEFDMLPPHLRQRIADHSYRMTIDHWTDPNYNYMNDWYHNYRDGRDYDRWLPTYHQD